MNRWRWMMLVSHALAVVLGLWVSDGFQSRQEVSRADAAQPKSSLRERSVRVPPARLLAAVNDRASMLEVSYPVAGSIPYSELIATYRENNSSQNRERYREVLGLWFERESAEAFEWLDQCSVTEIRGGAVSAAIDRACGGDPIAFLNQTKDWSPQKRVALTSELASWCAKNPGWVRKVYDALDEEQTDGFLSNISMISGPLPSPDMISILSNMPFDQSRRIISRLGIFSISGSASVTQADLDASARAVALLPAGRLRDEMEGLLAKAISNHLKKKIQIQASTDPAAAIRAVKAASLGEDSASRWIETKLGNALDPARQPGFNHALQMAALGEGDVGLALGQYFEQVADAPESLRNKFYKTAFAAAIEVDPQQAIDSAIARLGRDAAIELFPSHSGADSNIHSHARFVACAAEAELLPNEEDAIPDTVRNLYRVDRKAANEWGLGLARPEARRLAVDTLTGMLRMDDLSSEAVLMRGKAGMEK